MSKFIRNFLIGIAPIALLGLGTQVHAQATDVDCFHCIDTRDIAFQAVTRNKIQPKAVTTGKIAFKAVTKNKIASGAVTTGKIKDGAVTVAKVAPELSNAIGMFCLPDETVVGMDTSGIFSCDVPQTLASDGSNNTRAGTGALNVNTTGSKNTAFGHQALSSNTTGFQNTAFGHQALSQNNGNANTAVGNGALSQNNGFTNTAVGDSALRDNATGSQNTAFGQQALINNTFGFGNTAVGNGALSQNNGSFNIAIGLGVGGNQTTGNNNIAIGNVGVPAEERTIRIGHGGTHNRTFIAGTRGILTGIDDAETVVIDSLGQLGTISSSRRFKEDISDMDDASERVLSLRPVTFRYKKAFAGGEKPIQFGLVAEEVADVFPELVIYNDDGIPESVKYRLLSTLLLNELQKQGAELRGQQTELQALTARLDRLETAKLEVVASIQ